MDEAQRKVAAYQNLMKLNWFIDPLTGVGHAHFDSDCPDGSKNCIQDSGTDIFVESAQIFFGKDNVFCGEGSNPVQISEYGDIQINNAQLMEQLISFAVAPTAKPREIAKYNLNKLTFFTDLTTGTYFAKLSASEVVLLKSVAVLLDRSADAKSLELLEEQIMPLTQDIFGMPFLILPQEMAQTLAQKGVTSLSLNSGRKLG